MLLIDTMLGNDDLEEKEEMKNALVKQIAKKKKLRRPRITSCKNILTGHRGIKIWIEQRQCPTVHKASVLY